MRRPASILVTALALILATAGAAQAVVTNPQFTLAPHTKAQTGAGNAVTANLVWLPGFIPIGGPNDKQIVGERDITAGASVTTYSAGGTTNSFPLLLTNGHDYEFLVGGCAVATCSFADTFNTITTSGTTRIDATPPTGTVQINAGAVATNNRAVTLNLTGTDPLIGGIPNTSSGVTQQAVDVDGDGTYPCSLLGDLSGCAGNFAAAVQATIPAGDGIKTVGAKVGDGARPVTAPCPPGIFCAVLFGSPILGNESAPVTDTIILDTVEPTAVANQNRFTIPRGGSVTFNANASTDPGNATPSGVNLPASTWRFNDGTAQATGTTVTHTYNQVGTFVGELRVRDRAGNVSDPRSFAVTVTGDTSAGGGGSATGITGTAAFSISRIKVTARYTRSRLKGSVRLEGQSTQAGRLRTQIRKTPRGRILRSSSTTLRIAPFATTIKLPATLLPGSYRLAFVGPGGTLATRLRLKGPREGVIRSGRVRLTSGGASATFSFAARPVAALRGKLTVSWSQGGRSLGTVGVGKGTTVRASLPGGASIGSGRLRAVLRAGTIVVGSAEARLR